MAGNYTIELSGLRFFSNHGLYAEESAVGAEFEVNVAIKYAPAEGMIGNIDETIDYVAVYNIVKEQAVQQSELLETTVKEIAYVLKEKFRQIIHIQINLKKLAPPITNFVGNVSVTYEETF